MKPFMTYETPASRYNIVIGKRSQLNKSLLSEDGMSVNRGDTSLVVIRPNQFKRIRIGSNVEIC
jgi:hypothetical protein